MNYRKAWFRIKVFLKDKNKKPIPVILSEFFGLWMHKKSFPIHYFGRFFYRKDYKDLYGFIDMKQYREIVFSKRNNQDPYANLLGNKLFFSIFCERHGLSTPRLLGYNMGDRFFFIKISLKSLNHPKRLWIISTLYLKNQVFIEYLLNPLTVLGERRYT